MDDSRSQRIFSSGSATVATQDVESFGLSRRARWLLLLVFALTIALMRLHNYNEPTERDEATYAVIAHELLAGKQLYAGVLLDQKPPAIHFTYGLAEILVGYGRPQIYFLGVCAAIATMIGFYFAGKSFGKNGGLWAAALWTAINTYMPAEANLPNAEVFINAFTVLALVFLLKNPSSVRPWRAAVFAGIFFAAGSLYKHIAITIPVMVLLARICVPPEGCSRKQALLETMIIAGIGALAWVSVFAYFAATGRWKGIVDCLVFYNLHYSSSHASTTQPPQFFDFGNIYHPMLLRLLPFAFVALLGLAMAWTHRRFFHAAFLTGLALGSYCAIGLPGRFFTHYYQLWLPFGVFGIVMALHLIGPKKTPSPRLERLVGFAMLVILVAMEAPVYFRSPTQNSLITYGEVFVRTDRIARDIDAVLKPTESFWQFGGQPQLYLDTKRRPPGALANYGMFEGPLSDRLTSRTLECLKARPPELVVVEESVMNEAPQDHPLVQWIRVNYGCTDRNHQFSYWNRNDSDVGSRLAALESKNHSKRR